MKRRFIGGLMAAALLAGTCSAVFQDIQSPELAQTAAVLEDLGIMEGDKTSSFAPQRQLTRAEFAKLLVSAFGITDVTAYKNFTVFPDVPNSHWAAGYINAAVKHADLKKMGIIHGYADGTFQPDKAVSYGEACTMLVLMLGYTTEEVGPMWPGDYIARAQSEGLTDGASVMTASSTLTRADAAVMLLNTLNTPGKEDSKLIDRLTSSSDTESAILLATSETDSDLRKNQARFYTGEDEPVVKMTEGILDRSFIGVSGTLYYSKTSKNRVITMLPDEESRLENYTVQRAERDRIQTEEAETLKPERDVLMYAGGKVAKFSETWYNLKAGDDIALHYDKDGKLALISVAEQKLTDRNFIYGTKNAVAIPSGYSIVKNGMRVSQDSLKKYDIVTLDIATKTALVSDVRISGRYEGGTPSFRHPETAVVLGESYPVSARAASYFDKFDTDDRITLLFDAQGQVAAALPVNELRAEMVGAFIGIEEDKAVVRLLNGKTVRGVLDSDDSRNQYGRLVSVSQSSNGKMTLVQRSLTNTPAGNWDIQAGTLGRKQVSPEVRVWEQVADRAPIHETEISDLPFETIQSKDIRYVHSDSAGTVSAIVLGDVTGDAWNYGFASFTSAKLDEDGTPTGKDEVTLRYYDYEGKARKDAKYWVSERPEGFSGGLVGLPKKAEESEAQQKLACINLNRVDSVRLDAFDGEDGVRTAAGYYPLSDEVQVYVGNRQQQYITLDEAKANYDHFTLYAERPPEKGGKIRVIMVN